MKSVAIPNYVLGVLIWSLAACQSSPSEMPPPQNEQALNQEYIHLGNDERRILTYNVRELCPLEDSLPRYYCRSGFIHPLYSPNGKVLTDGFPVGHTHQHGVFFAWVNTHFKGTFHDFWNQQKETGTGRHVDLVSTDGFSQFETTLEQVSLKHGPVISENWKVKTQDKDTYYTIDLLSTQTNLTTDTLFIKKYHYGGLGIRGNAAWNKEDPSFNGSLAFLTSLGDSTEAANHTRPMWTAMYGKVDGDFAGIAVLDHPSNFRYPQPVRVHPTMPYFCMAPMVLDSMPIAPQQIYTSRYRLITFDGKPNTGLLEQLATAFAKE